MSVQCNTCNEWIETPPKMPLRVLQEEYKQVIATDYSAVYTHIRIAHPEQWTPAMAAGYELHRTSGSDQ